MPKGMQFNPVSLPLPATGAGQVDMGLGCLRVCRCLR